jgi:hypothetical protein
MLYDFSSLNQALTQWGFPKVNGKKGYHVVQGVDFEKAFKSNEIKFESDGIYIEQNGKKIRSYMFIQEAYITYNGGPEKFPKFHVLKCKTIQGFIDSGRFDQRYELSNTDVNDLIDKQSRIPYKKKKLEICRYCQEAAFRNVPTTEDFFKLYIKDSLISEKLEVDIDGYVKDKEKISKHIRSKNNYTCELCQVKSRESLHNIYWHTHHKDGNKLNNSESNLQCLCVLCHSTLDGHHLKNASKAKMQYQIKTFYELYKNELSPISHKKMKQYQDHL